MEQVKVTMQGKEKKRLIVSFRLTMKNFCFSKTKIIDFKRLLQINIKV